MKKMLMVNGTLNDVPLVEAAHRLGFYVITSGNDPKGEAHKYADEYRPVDYSDKEAVYRLAKELQVDAICSCGNDLCAMAAAYAAEKLGLPGHDTYETAKVFQEKDAFHEVTQRLGLSVPWSEDFADIDAAQAYVRTADYPLIIKPTDLGGGKGISVAQNPEEALMAVRNAFAASKAKHIVVEQFITGTQHAFICYIAKGKVVFDYSSNDTSYKDSYMVWTSSGHPADGYERVREQIIADVERLAQEVHAADGILTVQYMMCNGKAYYLETMRRCLGNFHFYCISKDIGVDFYEWFVASEAGLDCSKYWKNVRFSDSTSGFIGLYAEANGIVDHLEVDEEFSKLIFRRCMFEGPGYRIEDWLHDKIGNFLFTCENKEQRDRLLARRESLVKVVTIPEK